MAGGAIAAAIMGVSATAAAAATAMAQSGLATARGNLRGAMEVYNGTQYSLKPVRYMHRHGAMLNGIEGEFKEVPGHVDPRSIDTFVFQQNAATDNIGFVIYESEIFELMVAWHFYDLGKINRFVQATIHQKGYLTGLLPKSDKNWGLSFGNTKTGSANNMIWSGSGKEGNKEGRMADGIAPSSALRYHGEYRRGIVERDPDGNILLSNTGEPQIREAKMYGRGMSVSFSAIAYGGGETSKIYIADTDMLHDGGKFVVGAMGADAAIMDNKFYAEYTKFKSDDERSEHPFSSSSDFEM